MLRIYFGREKFYDIGPGEESFLKMVWAPTLTNHLTFSFFPFIKVEHAHSVPRISAQRQPAE
jgi:hypothetical protein